MARKTTFIFDSASKVETNATYGKTSAEKMARIAHAPIFGDVTECDAISAYPKSARRVTPIRLSNSTPDWLVNPENYRCIKCRRYCSDSFLVDKICGYCRGDY